MSLVAIVVISLITNYTGKLIIECLYEKPFNDQGTRGVRLRNSYALIGNTDFEVKITCKIMDGIVVMEECFTRNDPILEDTIGGYVRALDVEVCFS